MTTFRSEEMLIGLIALAAVPWIFWVLVRGRRDQRLPIGRSHVRQDERPGAYRVLFLFYIVAAALMLFISLDLMLGLGTRS
jgi:ABC-type cobalamin transport system permease subunit